MAKPDYTALTFPPAPAGRPYVIVNMVMSADGKTVFEGNEQGIGTKTDQRLMRELRFHADVVFNGAETMRKSGISPRVGDAHLEAMRVERGKPRSAASAVVTRSGDLPLDRAFFTATDFDAYVYLGHDAPAGVFDRIAATGRAVAQLPREKPMSWMLAHMKFELGAGLVLCEGGSTVNGQLVAEDAVDELFITLGPVVVAGRGHPGAVEGTEMTKESAPRLNLIHAVPNEETGEIYLRYRVRRDD